MTRDRATGAWRSATDRTPAARPVLRVGSWKASVTVVAWGLSAILHGGLLAASHFVTWSPAPVSNPEISFARGDQATRIQILMVPWPDPVEEERTNEETYEDESAAELRAVTVSAVNLDVVPPTEDVAADGAAEATARLQPVKDILDHLVDRFEWLLVPPETSEQVDGQQPLVAEAVEEAAAPLTDEAIESNPSSSQTAGIETGVEMLDLPTPVYPPLSRRRGEEGLVLLQVEVLPDGTVGDIEALRDAGFPRLTEAAIAAARKARFRPATRDGHPIRTTVRIPFRFVLTLSR